MTNPVYQRFTDYSECVHSEVQLGWEEDGEIRSFWVPLTQNGYADLEGCGNVSAASNWEAVR